MAMGVRISVPGSSPRRARGISASPEASAVMRMGASRSIDPRRTAFSSEGELIATGTSGRIRIWDVRSQTLLAEIEDQHKEIRSLCFSSDDTMLRMK